MGTSMLLSAIGADGRAIPAIQPRADSVQGSPFTVGTTSMPTPELSGSMVAIIATQPVHLRFSRGATPDPAVATDIFIPANQLLVFPIETGDYVSFLRAGTEDANVFIHEAQETR